MSEKEGREVMKTVDTFSTMMKLLKLVKERHDKLQKPAMRIREMSLGFYSHPFFRLVYYSKVLVSCTNILLSNVFDELFVPPRRLSSAVV
jgi:hypothetical protein